MNSTISALSDSLKAAIRVRDRILWNCEKGDDVLLQGLHDANKVVQNIQNELRNEYEKLYIKKNIH
jgi:hypothetical protein